MVSGLQCPGCGHVHALDEVGSADTFRCLGCRRLLSVPAVVTGGGAAPGAGTAPEPAAPPGPASPSGTEAADGPGPAPGPLDGRSLDGAAAVTEVSGVAPVAGEARPEPSGPPTGSGRVPAPVRFLVWLVALPAGVVVALVPLRVLGLLDLDDAIDVFAGTGLGRFAVLLVLLPLWAGVSATLAHLALEGLARRRARKTPD